MATEKLKFLVTADTKGFALGMKAVAALAVTAFAAAIKVSAEFEKSLSKLRAVSEANETQMKSLQKQSRNLGKTTAFTAVEVAKLQVELAKLGFTTNDILNSSGGILDLAASLGVELADAAVLAGSTIRAFGLTTEETGRVVDVLAKATASSALDFSKLTESLKLAAPIAKLYNFTIEDTVAMLAQLANAGIHGSQAGTGLRQVFLELDKKGISLNDALKQVNESSNKAGTAFKLVGKRAAGVLAIIASGKGEIDDLALELYNAEGAAESMRLTMEDNLIGDFAKLQSAVTEMGLKLGEQTDGPLRDFVQWMTDVINGTPDTLGAVDSLARVFLFLEESILLAFKAAEEFWQFQQRNNPIGWIDQLFGGDGMFQESVDRLNLIKARLSEINGEIIKLSDYGGGGDTPGDGGENKKPKKKKKKNTVGGTISSGYLSDLSHMLTLERQAGKSRYELAEAELAWLEALDKTTLSASQQEDVLKRTQVLTQGLATGFFDAATEIDTFKQDLQGLFDSLLSTEEIFIRDWHLKLKDWLDKGKITFEEFIKYLNIVDQALTEKAGKSLSKADQILNNGISNMIQSAAEAFASGENLGGGLLSGIGAILTQLGGLLIVTGLGIEAFKDSLKSLDPTVAIVAGAAMIVAGAAFSNAAKKAGGGVGNTPATRSPVGSSTTTPSSIQGSGNGGELVATVRGQDLRFILQAANDSYSALN